MNWYNFECRRCNKELNARKFALNYKNRFEYESICLKCYDKGCAKCKKDFLSKRGTGIAYFKKNIGYVCSRCFYSKEFNPCVYLLFSRKANIFKIGTSFRLRQRIKEINRENKHGSDFELILKIEFKTEEDARNAESMSHKYFKRYLIPNEKEYFENSFFLKRNFKISLKV